MEDAADPDPPAAALQRVDASARLAVRRRADGVSALAQLEQRGGAKLLAPRRTSAEAAAGAPFEAIALNTAGGLTGGDRFALAFEVGAGAALSAAPQAAERVYRAAGGTATATLRLDVADGGRAEWLGQETILFDGGRLSRRIEVDLAPTAELLLVETLVFGRGAMGETVHDGRLRDVWRVRRAGRLAFAEALAIDAPIDAALERPALGGGARAIATILVAGPDPERRLIEIRPLLEKINVNQKMLDAAASLTNDLLVLRACAVDPARLRDAVTAIATALRGVPPPRVWRC